MKKIIAILLVLLGTCRVFGQGFSEQEVTISYTDPLKRDITLTGTLTVPDGSANTSYPAVILITGSGSQNRDEELLGHKPFKVIAEYLSARGWAVLRCDDRGVGGSTGVYDDVTTLHFANDVEAMYKYLRKHPSVNRNQIGLIGHSEGGLIAPIVASRNRGMAFVVMLAGPGMNGAQTLLEQNEDLFRLRGLPDTLVQRRLAFMRDVFDTTDMLMMQRKADPAMSDTVELVKYLNRAYKGLMQKRNAGLTKEQKQQAGLTSTECYGWAATMAMPWMRTFCTLEPADYLSQLQCPVLALNGTKDCQVRAAGNLQSIQRVCQAGGVRCTTRPMQGRNHLFQLCGEDDTGMVEEYERLGQAPDDETLETIYQWISKVLE